MMAVELKEQFKNLIRQGKLEKGFNLLNTYVCESNEELETEILLIQGQFSDLQRRYNVNVINGSSYNIERQSISERIHNVVKTIKDEDVHKETQKEVLIICRNEKDENYMRSFCNQQKDLQCDVKQLKTYEEPTDYKFIVFDNHSIEDIENEFELKEDEIAHLALMKEYIEEYSEHKKYMIHFGEMTRIVNKNRDIIYAANSKFALYSRIKEMYLFIENNRLYNMTSAA